MQNAPERFSEYHTELTASQIAELVRISNTPEEAAARIKDYALEMWKGGYGKGDNVTVTVQRITE